MENTLYPLGNIFDSLMNGETIARISLKQSIKEHLYILLSTIPNEYLFDRNYGCELLSTDFNIEKKDNEINLLSAYITDSVIHFEPRIDPKSFYCKLDIDTEEKNFTLRKKLKMELSMKTIDGTEAVTVYIEYYLSPFAIA